MFKLYNLLNRTNLTVFLIATFFNILCAGYLKYMFAYSSDLLPYMQSFLNPAMRVDLTVMRVSATPSFYYIIPAMLTKFFSVDAITYALFFLQNYLMAFAVLYFAFYLFKKKSVAYASLILLMFGGASKITLGGAPPIFGYNVFADMLATPILLFALILFMKRRYKSAFALTALAANFHLLYTVYIIIMFLLYFVVNYKRVSLREIARSLGLFIIISLPVTILIFLESRSVLTIVDEFALFNLIHGVHSAPFSWGIERWVLFSMLIALFLFSFRYAPDKIKNRKIIIFLCAIVLMCLIGTVFAEFIPIREVLEMSFFRSTRLFTVIAVFYIANFILLSLQRSNFWKLSGLIVLLSFSIWNKFYLGLTMALILGLIFFDREMTITHKRKLFLLTPVLSLVAILLLSALKRDANFTVPLISKLVNNYVFILPFILLFVISLVLLFGVIFRKSVFAYLAILIIVVFYFTISHGEMLVQFPPDTRTYLDRAGDWLAAQEWVQENTPRDAILFVPPYAMQFRSYSARAVVATASNVDEIVYTPVLFPEVLRRFQDYGVDIYAYKNKTPNEIEADLEKLYNSFDEKKFIELAIKYNATYIVVETPKSLNFSLVFTNNNFAIYKI